MTASRIVFVHAHPDDEAIFTGGTMALLRARGAEVTLLCATGGELGAPVDGPDSADRCLAEVRRSETVASCAALGVHDVRFLGWHDSGLAGENLDGLAHVDPEQVAARIADEIATLPDTVALVGYDDHGIYGHPDHVAVYRAVCLATERAGLATRYDSTVDREYLHFVETHVVVEAGFGERPRDRGLAATDLGLSTLDIDVAIKVGPALAAKRRALQAHATQIPVDAPLFELGELNFEAVYGWEWYRRVGPPTVLDALAH